MNTTIVSSESSALPAVLHLDSGTTWGGGQKQVLLLMRELARRGVRQTCLCPAQSVLAARLREASLPVQGIAWRGGADPRAAWHIWRSLAHYDIAHCHDAHALQLAILPGWLRSRPIVAARRIAYPARPAKWNRAERVIAVSQTVRRTLTESGVDEQRIRVIHSGIDIKSTRDVAVASQPVRQAMSIPPESLVVVNAGSLVAIKGQVIIPRAAAEIADVHWIIAGEGPERSRLEADADRLGVAQRVHIIGFVRDTRALIKEADIYLSAAPMEGLGNSILEALALNVPVLSTDSGGGAEIVAPVQAAAGASIFKAEDPGSLVAAVNRLRDPQLRARVVALQNERLRDFTIERTAANTMDVYSEVWRP